MPPGVQASNQPQHIIITTQPVSSNQGNDPTSDRMTFMEYFVDQQQPTATTIVPAVGATYQPATIVTGATTSSAAK